MLIGLCGRAGSGKTEAAKIIQDRYGYQRIRFAAPLKNMLKALGLTHEEVDGRMKEAPCKLLGGRTPRWAMQALGTEWGRELIDDDIWVRAWKNNLTDPDSTVADDVRYWNEAKAIRDLGGRVIKIVRYGIMADIEVDHPSETLDFDVDAVVLNNGDLEDLARNISKAVEK